MHSFVELSKTLLEIEDLVEHFGRQRMKGGGINNPTVCKYGHNKRKIILTKSDMLTVMQGKTTKRFCGEAKVDVNDERQLPKWKKK